MRACPDCGGFSGCWPNCPSAPDEEGESMSTFTPEQLEQRREKIGSSEAAAICGVSPYANALEVFLEKTGRCEPFSGNEATEAGIDLEPSIIRMAERRLKPVCFEKNVKRQHPNGIMAATLDTIFTLRSEPSHHERVIVECKSAGIVSYLNEDIWTEDRFPDWYEVQVQYQLACSPDIDYAYLAALTPPRGFRLYLVERNHELQGAIVERCERFWHEHVLADIAPDGSVCLDVAKRLRRQPNKVVELPNEIAALFDEAKAMLRDAAEREESAKASLLYAMGDAEQGECLTGVYTYFPNKNGVRTLRKKSLRKVT